MKTAGRALISAKVFFGLVCTGTMKKVKPTQNRLLVIMEIAALLVIMGIAALLVIMGIAALLVIMGIAALLVIMEIAALLVIMGIAALLVTMGISAFGYGAPISFAFTSTEKGGLEKERLRLW